MLHLWVLFAILYAIPALALIGRTRRPWVFLALSIAIAVAYWLLLPLPFPRTPPTCSSECDGPALTGFVIGDWDWLTPTVWIVFGLIVGGKALLLWRDYRR